uniref:Suprabasin n=1 Tax=Pipistrellus kuhlii TaxID=59472 RepID=A0A7J7V1F7_PIPKU|nr:suprabasin [Pipistrellus kuhlii]
MGVADKVRRDNLGVRISEGGHQGGSTGHHGGGATTTLTSGASVNKPFISFPALWRSVANIIP